MGGRADIIVLFVMLGCLIIFIARGVRGIRLLSRGDVRFAGGNVIILFLIVGVVGGYFRRFRPIIILLQELGIVRGVVILVHRRS